MKNWVKFVKAGSPHMPPRAFVYEPKASWWIPVGLKRALTDLYSGALELFYVEEQDLIGPQSGWFEQMESVYNLKGDS